MTDFFKTFGLGVLYIVLLPIILAYLLLYALYCLVMLIYEAGKVIIFFFSGRPIFPTLKEDKEAKAILEERMAEKNVAEQPQQNSTTNTTTNTNNYYSTNNYYNQSQNAFIGGEQFTKNGDGQFAKNEQTGTNNPNSAIGVTKYSELDSHYHELPHIENQITENSDGDDELKRPSFIDKEIKEDEKTIDFDEYDLGDDE